jgi:signal transduction histidine kinase
VLPDHQIRSGANDDPARECPEAAPARPERRSRVDRESFPAAGSRAAEPPSQAPPGEPRELAAPPRRDRAARDVLVVVAATLAAAALSAYFELSEILYRFTRGFESFQLDEAPTVLIVLALALIWFSHRRHRQTLRELGARRAAERRLSDALAENRRLADRHIRIQEAERKSLARELHDELGQYLNAIKLDAVAMREAAGDEAAAARAGGDIVQSVDHVHRAVSGLIRRLRPVGLDELGLAAAVEHCIDHWRRRMPHTEFAVALDGDLVLDEAASLTVYRLLQEALTNCSRHAGAARIDVSLTGAAAGTELVVADDGHGMDAAASRSGFGLAGMRERVELMGGELAIDSAPGRGFRLRARLPRAQRRPR